MVRCHLRTDSKSSLPNRVDDGGARESRAGSLLVSDARGPRAPQQ